MSSLLSAATGRIRAFDAEEEQHRAEKRRQQEAARAAAEKDQREKCHKWLAEWIKDATVPDLPTEANIRTLECETKPFAHNIEDYTRINKVLQDLCKEEGLYAVQVTLPNGNELISPVSFQEETDCCDGMGTYVGTFIRDVWKGDNAPVWHVRIKIKM